MSRTRQTARTIVLRTNFPVKEQQQTGSTEECAFILGRCESDSKFRNCGGTFKKRPVVLGRPTLPSYSTLLFVQANDRLLFHLQLCNGIRDCSNGVDEASCNQRCSRLGMFQCANGSCIRQEQRCDSVPQCEDSSDELDCETTCKPNQVKCSENIESHSSPTFLLLWAPNKWKFSEMFGQFLAFD